MRPGSDAWILRWAQDHLSRQYDLVGQVQILGPDRTDYFWDDLAALAPDRQVNRLLIFRRRDFAPRVRPASRRPAGGDRRRAGGALRRAATHRRPRSHPAA
jgi:hypothetical protein